MVAFTPFHASGARYPVGAYAFIVSITFREEATTVDRQDIFDAYQRLPQLCGGTDAGFLDYTVNWNSDKRPGFNGATRPHLGEFAVFADKAAADRYRAHPAHKAITDKLTLFADWQLVEIIVGIDAPQAEIDDFTPAECVELERLMRKLAKANGFWPTEHTMRAGHSAISMWAPEVLITREHEGRTQVLLGVYDGGAEFFQGMWHLFGGYHKLGEPDVQTTCSRHAKGIGVAVRYDRIVGEHKWRPGEHPYGHPLSLFCLCTPLGEIVETDKVRFFDLDELPENTVACHREFLKTYLT